MSSMNFTCDVCGREVFSCTFVNGMKFCAKCYQETFGETDKDRKIADLEAKLAESEKQIKDAREAGNMAVDSWCKNRRKYEAQIAEMQNKSFILYSMLYETLEKQGCDNVASQIDQMTGWTYDKEVNWLKGNRNYDQLKQSQKQLTEKERQLKLAEELLIKQEKEYDEQLEKQAKIHYKHLKEKDQDKISFAVEQLEQLKKLCQEKFNWWENSEWEGDVYDKSDVSNAYFDIEANIDNQIKQLKEGK